jgi:hypothetical protein
MENLQKATNLDIELFNLLLLNVLNGTQHGFQLNQSQKKELVIYVLKNVESIELDILRTVIVMAREGKSFSIEAIELTSLLTTYKLRCETLVKTDDSAHNRAFLDDAQRMYDYDNQNSSTRGPHAGGF